MKRLIDDPEIVGELRAELQRYATEQAQVDLKRAFENLEGTLQLKAAGTAGAARPGFWTWSALSGSTKLLIIAAIGGSSALGVAALRSSEPTLQPQATVQALPAAALPPSEPQPSAAWSPAGASRPQLQPTASPPARLAEPSASRSPVGSGSRREIAQLARIKSVLDHDPAAARRLIRTAQREFPAGLLVEEREGLDVIALFALGQHERARTSAERFIARYPQSPLRPKLERLIDDARE